MDETKRVDISKLSLNQFLSKYTSEDNKSFQELHDRDRQEFLLKVSWMFSQNEKHARLNQLAIENGSGAIKMVTSEDKVRTVPALQMSEGEAQSSFFFRKPGENLARAYDHQVAVRESQASIPQSLADTEAQRISKTNTRFSSQYLVEFLEKDVPDKKEPF